MSHSTDHQCDVSNANSDVSFNDSFRRCFATALLALMIILALTGAANLRQDTAAGPVPLPKLAGTGGTAEPVVSEARPVRHDDNSRGIRTGLWHATFREQEVRQDIDDETIPAADDAIDAKGDSPDSGSARIVVDSIFPADKSIQEEVLLSSGEEEPGLPSHVPSLSAIEIEDSKTPAELPEQLPNGPSNVTVIVLLIAAILSVGLMTSK